MNRFRRVIVIFSALLFSTQAIAQAVSVKLASKYEVESALRKNIEQNLSQVLNEVNHAYAAKSPIDIERLPMDKYAQKQLSQIWLNVKFYCDEPVLNCYLWNLGDIYMVRQISVMINTGYGSEKRIESLAFEFNKRGLITAVRFSAANLGEDVLAESASLQELKRNAIMVQYCDRYLSAFYTKDISFFNQIFGEDALVIVGKEVRAFKSLFAKRFHPQMEYKDSFRKEYLKNLKTCFNRSGYVSAHFENIVLDDGDEVSLISQSIVNPNFYGVRFHTKWESNSGYFDSGYTMLLWDFTNDDEPIVHVRTWQPDLIYGQRLRSTEIFSINDFGL